MKYLFIVFLSLISIAGFSQAKPDTAKVIPDTTQPKNFLIALPLERWQVIYNMILTSKTISAFDATEMTAAISQQIGAQQQAKAPANKEGKK